jgi:hypothetical protein
MMEKMAQDQSLNTFHIEPGPVARDEAVRPDRIVPARKRSHQGTDSCRLKADVAEALFEVHRLEAIVEDLAVVVARVGRVTGGIDEVEDRIDHLERNFGT